MRSSLVLATTALLAVALSCSDAFELLGPPLSPGRGRLALELVDAPNVQVRQINVTLSQVLAHSEKAGWVRIFGGRALTVDLLKLQDYALQLGFRDLPPGAITQLRLYLAEDGPHGVVLAGDVRRPLELPAGLWSGIRMDGPWELTACSTRTLTLDFDGRRSISVREDAGAQRWVLHPVLELKAQTQKSTECAGPEEAEESADLSTLRGAGSGCTAMEGCLSHRCVDGHCAPAGPGSPCRVAEDCAGGSCDPAGTCAASTAGGAGVGCAFSTDCLSNACVSALCQQGTQGALCQVEADCADFALCTAGDAGPLGVCRPRPR